MKLKPKNWYKLIYKTVNQHIIKSTKQGIKIILGGFERKTQYAISHMTYPNNI